jgi:hypothetical protein
LRRRPSSGARRLVAGLALAALAAGCRSEVELTIPRALPTATCAANGAGCATPGDCCSGACVDAHCATGACRAEGAECAIGADCCSFVCATDPAGSGRRVCAIPAGCSSDGQSCAAAPADCCSGTCMGGMCAMVPVCRPAGETCAKNDECCGRICAERGESGVMGCQLLSACRADGEICATGDTCCSGRCTTMPGGTGRCQALPGCRPALEPCMDAKDCCSGLCAPSLEPSGPGPNRCVRADGCQPEQERCATGATCCSGVCNVGPEGVGRCAKAPRPMADHCRVLGELCMKPDECCAGTRCHADAAGAMRCLPKAGGCSAAGFPCSVGEQCCGHRCLPDGTGGYTCRDTCAPAGAACSATADCCGGSCVGAPGATVCVPAAGATDPICVAPGDACESALGACCAGTACAQLASGGRACAPVK